MRNTDDFFEKFAIGIVVAVFVLVPSVMIHSAYTWPAEFIRSNAGDQHFLRGTVVNLASVEGYGWHYHYQTYDLRRNEPHSPSVGVVQMPEDNDVGFGISVYAVQLDGANQGYAGFVARSSDVVSEGTRVTCGLGRIYYPTRDRSQFAFWLECKGENTAEPLRPIHECKLYDSHYVLITCPDEEAYNRRRTVPQWW